jgi:Protein of unknown function (DUF3300)
MKILQKSLAFVLSGSLLFAAAPVGAAYAAQSDQSAQQNAPQAAMQSPEELQQLVAPIALYPDELVSQVLAAATYPTEIVEADRWLQDHPNLKGKELADEVDKQPWDPSVKALTQFPSVLGNMDKNLSWTSSLGEAYVNQPNDVMDAVQAMRARAQKSGNLKSNEQEKVKTQGKTIVIEPAQPDIVYVPAYDPWVVYGGPIVAWPGWYAYPGLFIGGPGISFGLGFGIGFFGGFGWGWGHWGADWGHGRVAFDHRAYISHSRAFANRGGGFANRNNFARGNNFNRSNSFNRTSNNRSAGNFNHATQGRSGAFGGFNHGGMTHSFSARGRSSFGGGFHGGGFHGGGGRR